MKKLLLSLLFISIATPLLYVKANTEVRNIVNEIYQSRDIDASFPGGNKALSQFLSQTIVYPQLDADARTEGIVYVRFKIDKFGKVSEAKVTQGINPVLDAEALRVVSLMPTWNPSIIDGEAVDSYYTMPFSFRRPSTTGKTITTTTTTTINTSSIAAFDKIKDRPIIIFNGEMLTADKIKSLITDEVQTLQMIPYDDDNKEWIEKNYGDAGIYGVVIITTRASKQ